jgi:hypothetical protein
MFSRTEKQRKKTFSGTGQNKTRLASFWCLLVKSNANDLSLVFSEEMFSRTETQRKKTFSGIGQNKIRLASFWCLLVKSKAAYLSSVFSEEMFSQTETHVTSPLCIHFVPCVKIPHTVRTSIFYSTQITAQHRDNEQFV